MDTGVCLATVPGVPKSGTQHTQGSAEKGSLGSATLRSQVQVPTQHRKNSFGAGRGSWEGWRKQRTQGFPLAQLYSEFFSYSVRQLPPTARERPLLVTWLYIIDFSLVAQSGLTLRPHGLRPARPPCPSPTPGAYSSSCPSSR